jgi:DHA1 family bicyclomycin/chloramphenicol resistance-like MFS transporter
LLLVPVIAPAMGKFILDYYNWHGIFYIQVLISIFLVVVLETTT